MANTLLAAAYSTSAAALPYYARAVKPGSRPSSPSSTQMEPVKTYNPLDHARAESALNKCVLVTRSVQSDSANLHSQTLKPSFLRPPHTFFWCGKYFSVTVRC